MGNKFCCYTGSKSLLMLSDILFLMTVTLVIYQDTQSVAYAAVFPLIRTLCQLLAGLLSPVLTELFQAKRLLKWVPLLRIGMLVVFTTQFNFFHQHLIWLFSAFVLISITGGFISPLLQAIMPMLVPANQLVKANSTASVFYHSVQIAGYSFTGIRVIKGVFCSIRSLFYVCQFIYFLCWNNCGYIRRKTCVFVRRFVCVRLLWYCHPRFYKAKK
ncbi:hypothetical protein ABQG68_14125 [Bacillus pumilus]|uniref:hypothetical protein n=1 Tax=Bacillus pumilus TaxID=1408 RepID=UPI003315D4C4